MEIFVYRKHINPITSIYHDDQFIYSADNIGNIFMWCRQSRRVLASAFTNSHILNIIAFNGYLVSYSRDGKVNIYNAKNLYFINQIIIYKEDNSPIGFCKMTNFNELFVFPNGDENNGKIIIYSLCLDSSLEFIGVFSNNSENKQLGMLTCLSFIAKNKLALGYESGSVYVLDINDRTSISVLRIIEGMSTSPIFSLYFWNNYLCIGTAEKSLFLSFMDENSKENFFSNEALIHEKYSSWKHGISDITSCGDYLVTGHWDKCVRFWSLSISSGKLELKQILKLSQRCAVNIVTSHDHLFVGREDGFFSEYNLQNI